MIKNLIFDMGGVLMVFDPEYFIEMEKIEDPADRDLLMKEIYHNPQWHALDMGELDEEEMYEDVLRRIPERLHHHVHSLMYGWNEALIPIEGMEELLRQCHDAGYKLYLLSNASRRQPGYWPYVPGNQYFDGMVVSALERCCKPDSKLFEILLDRYGLKPEECLFIDDSKRNVEAAEKLGIKGYWFDKDIDKLKEFLRQNTLLFQVMI